MSEEKTHETIGKDEKPEKPPPSASPPSGDIDNEKPVSRTEPDGEKDS